MVEDKCKDCFAYLFDHKLGYYCIAPVCMKEYDYDPETRSWIPKKDISTIEEIKNKKEKYDFEIQAWLEFPPETQSQLKKFHDSMISIHLGGVGMKTILSKYTDPHARLMIFSNYGINYPK